MSGKRQSRFKQVAKPRPICLGERDKQLLIASYTYRFLTRNQLQKLFNWQCTSKINRRLRRLWDQKYLSRRILDIRTQAIYSLGPRGIALVAQWLGESPKIVKKRRDEDLKAKELFLNHSLALNDVRIAVCLGGKK